MERFYMVKSFIITALVLLSSSSTLAFANSATFDPKSCGKPEYPKSSLMNEEQGTVILNLLINPDGSVSDSKVEKTSGFKNLDKAAQKALIQCKFKSSSAKSEWQSVEYAWKLD